MRIKPYRLAEHLLIDVQQIVPLPEATEYQVRIQRKAEVERIASTNSRDLTKYDVTINGEIHQQLAKRKALFIVVKYLCDRGVTPDQITTTINYRTHTDLWRYAEGRLSAATFHAELSALHTIKGRSYESHRAFSNDEELIYAEGKTFAFTNQWSKEDFVIAMDRLRDANLVSSVTFSYAKSG